MARPEYATIRDLPDYAVTNTWEVDFRPPASVNIYGAKLNAVASAISPRPSTTNTALTTNIRGVVLHQPGDSKQSDEITITLLETVDKGWTVPLVEWLNKCQDVKTKHAEQRKDVQGVLIITELNRQNEPVYRYTLEGCFIKEFKIPDFQSDQSLQEVTLSLTYDYYQEEKI